MARLWEAKKEEKLRRAAATWVEEAGEQGWVGRKCSKELRPDLLSVGHLAAGSRAAQSASGTQARQSPRPTLPSRARHCV